MIPSLYIRLEGDCSSSAGEKPFSPAKLLPLKPISGIQADVPENKIQDINRIINLLEELCERESILIIDGVRFWTQSKLVDYPGGGE